MQAIIKLYNGISIPQHSKSKADDTSLVISRILKCMCFFTKIQVPPRFLLLREYDEANL